MTQPHVTILIPTWERHEWLREALDSLLGQTHTNWTAWVADNGGASGADWSFGRIDPRIEYMWFPKHVSSVEQGARLLPLWKSGYGCFFFDDDLLEPTSLERRVAFLEQNPGVDVVVTAMRYFGGFDGIRDRDPASWTNDFLSLHDGTNTPTLMYRHPGLIPPVDMSIMHGGCDALTQYEMFLRGVRFGYIREPLYRYRIHGDQESNLERLASDPSSYDGVVKIFEKAARLKSELCGG